MALTYTDNLAGRWRASDIAGSDNDVLATWADTSGNLRDLTQATEANKPTLQTNELNGKAIVRFDGSNDGMSTASFTLTNPVTYFIVLKYQTDPSAQDSIITNLSLGDGYGNGLLYSEAFSEGVFLYNGTQLNSGDNIDDTDYHYITAVFNQGSSIIRLDGAEIGAGTTSNLDIDGINIAYRSQGGGSQWANIDVAEVLVYDEATSAGNITSVEGYFVAEYFTASDSTPPVPARVGIYC